VELVGGGLDAIINPGWLLLSLASGRWTSFLEDSGFFYLALILWPGTVIES